MQSIILILTDFSVIFNLMRDMNHGINWWVQLRSVSKLKLNFTSDFGESLFFIILKGEKGKTQNFSFVEQIQ